MELLLVNHPLDCPICDKGGECPLQNQAMSNGRGETRFTRHQARPSPSRSRSPPRCCSTASAACCAPRCTRFSEQIAGDPFIELLERGPSEQVGIAEDEPFESYFSGNTVQICPVGALTGASYRFRARPVRPGVDAERLRALRVRLRAAHRPPPRQGDPPPGRQRPARSTRSGTATRAAGRSPTPPSPTGWPPRWSATPTACSSRRPGRAAVAAAAAACRPRRGRAGVLTGGRLTVEDAYAYAKFARVALGTNDIDFRARPHSAEEAAFLAAEVAGRADQRDATPTWSAPRPCCWSGSSRRTSRRSCSCGCARRPAGAGSPSGRSRRWPVPASAKLAGALLPTVPGAEAEALTTGG